jgi:hypothetical protein
LRLFFERVRMNSARIALIFLSLVCFFLSGGCIRDPGYKRRADGMVKAVHPVSSRMAYDHYTRGLKLMKEGEYGHAEREFLKATEMHGRDSHKFRAGFPPFARSYFPHRERGCCLYRLWQSTKNSQLLYAAGLELHVSLRQCPSVRAKDLLSEVNKDWRQVNPQWRAG